jgi:RecB family endonuclease NucS
MFKSDGSVLVHHDADAKPLNWMGAAAMVETTNGAIIVRRRNGTRTAGKLVPTASFRDLTL